VYFGIYLFVQPDGGALISCQATLLNHDILSYDQPMRGHLAQFGQSALSLDTAIFGLYSW